MIFSKEQMFSDSQPITGATTVVSTNIIDLGDTGSVRNAPAGATGKLKRDIGPGEPIGVSITAFCTSAAPNTENLTVTLSQSANSDMSAPDVVAISKTMTVGQAGVSFAFNWMPDQVNRRYLQLSYTTAGAFNLIVDAGITMGKQTNVTVAAA